MLLTTYSWKLFCFSGRKAKGLTVHSFLIVWRKCPNRAEGRTGKRYPSVYIRTLAVMGSGILSASRKSTTPFFKVFFIKRFSPPRVSMCKRKKGAGLLLRRFLLTAENGVYKFYHNGKIGARYYHSQLIGHTTNTTTLHKPYRKHLWITFYDVLGARKICAAAFIPLCALGLALARTGLRGFAFLTHPHYDLVSSPRQTHQLIKYTTPP